MEYRFRRPPQCGVLIFDRTGAADLAAMALPGVEYSVLAARREEIFLSPGVLLATLRNMRLTERSHLGMLKGLPGRLYRAHLLACVQAISPQVIVTYVDNSFAFQWVCRHYSQAAERIAVQNGLRYPKNLSTYLPPAPLPGSRVELDTFLCFGTWEEDLYTRYQHRVESFVPCGSMRGAFYRWVIAPNPAEKEYDLCVVSEWEPVFMEGHSDYPAVTQGLSEMNACLSRFVRERPDLRVCVALRSSLASERDYYELLFGGRAVVIPSEPQDWSTYRAMDSSDVVMSFASTATTEAFGWGAKSFICNLSGDGDYDFPVPGPWALTSGTYRDFAAALDGLLAMSPDEFRSASRDAAAYVMDYRVGALPHELVRARVAGAVASGGGESGRGSDRISR